MKAGKENSNHTAARTVHRSSETPAFAPHRDLARSLGNRAFAHLLRSASTPRLQSKLAVSHPHDPLEQEAHRVADEVMRMPEPACVEATGPVPPVQRLCAECDEGLQRKASIEEEDLPLQGKREGAKREGAAAIEPYLDGLHGRGEP